MAGRLNPPGLLGREVATGVHRPLESALIDSMALVVQMIFLISRSNCRNGANSAQVFSQRQVISG
jgi:hypothetical protein